MDSFCFKGQSRSVTHHRTSLRNCDFSGVWALGQVLDAFRGCPARGCLHDRVTASLGTRDLWGECGTGCLTLSMDLFVEQVHSYVGQPL